MEIYIDGSSKGNPGPSRIAVVSPATGFKVIKDIGNGTNNRAEYLSLVYALIYIKHLKTKEEVTIKS
ncbi:MAG: hypothetical protein N2V72_00735, partial [Methanophagales archaeon]|nr:hypothetical protein [Methanophagales archaeon]